MNARAPLSLFALVLAGGMWSPPFAQPQLSVFFGNLHSHTALSDGSGTPDEAYTHARDSAGLDFLALTEHNHAQAGDIANNPALYTGPGTLSLIPSATRFIDNGTFVALYGQEFSTIGAGNHMNVIDAPQVIDVANGNFKALFEAWLPTHLDTLGLPPLLLLNHPAASDSPTNLEYGIDDYAGDRAAWLAAIDPRAELINLINGPSHEDTPKPPSRPSESEFLRYLNFGLHVAPTADQDNHKKNWGSATTARTGVVAPTLTKAALLTALRQRRAYATEDRNLRLVFQLNGQLLGSRIVGAAVPAAGTALTLTLQVTDDDEPTTGYTVEVLSDQIGGTAVAAPVRTQTVTGNGTHTITGVTYGGGDQYVFLRIRQTDGNRAWTAPVWLEPAGLPDPALPSGGDTGGDSAGVLSVSLTVDVQAETAVIRNTGTSTIELTGWRLVSVRGNQVFDQFPDGMALTPGQTLTITSGPTAKTGTGFLRWTNQNMWSNNGDPGRLIDVDGNVVAED